RSVKNRQDIKKTSELASRLFNRDLPKCYAVRPEGYEGAAHLVNDFIKTLGINSWKAGIKPRPVGTYKSAKDPILVCDESGSTYSIEASSKFFSAFADSDERSPFLWIDREIEGSNEAKKLLSDLKKKGYIDNLDDANSETDK